MPVEDNDFGGEDDGYELGLDKIVEKEPGADQKLFSMTQNTNYKAGPDLIPTTENTFSTPNATATIENVTIIENPYYAK